MAVPAGNSVPPATTFPSSPPITAGPPPLPKAAMPPFMEAPPSPSTGATPVPMEHPGRPEAAAPPTIPAPATSPFGFSVGPPAPAGGSVSLFGAPVSGGSAQVPGMNPSPFVGGASQGEPAGLAMTASMESGVPPSFPPQGSRPDESPAAPPNPSAVPTLSGNTVKLSLANLLKGYATTELGFDPGMVPSWITTSIPSSVVRDQLASGQVMTELGMLIDGITDIGFRNVLASARRDLRIQVPTNELFHGLPAAEQTQVAAQPAPSQPAPQATAASIPAIHGSSVPNPDATNPFAMATSAMPKPSSTPIQPIPTANFGFAGPGAPAPETHASADLHGPKPMAAFDPFAASTQAWSGQPHPAAFPSAQATEGLNSEQLFGVASTPPPLAPSQSPPMFFADPAPSEPAPPFAILPEIANPPAGPAPSQHPTASSEKLPTGLFDGFGRSSAQIPASEPPSPATGMLPPVQPEPAIPTAFSPAGEPSSPVATPAHPAAHAGTPTRPGSTSSFGISPISSGDTEQLMLRALLGVSENLTVDRVVDLISRIPGVAACACVNGTRTVAHGGPTPSAEDFKTKAPDLARNVQALAPLIGIGEAETYSINTSDRLMTFSFHAPIALGVLHQDSELAAGLRDKITLVGRELSRMVARSGGHIV